METMARGRIEGLLLGASWVERLRCELGLDGMHQVWGEVPAWYFWLAGSPGAHGLELAQVRRLGPGRENLLHAEFLVRFFPSPAGELFETFTPQERELVRGPHFDHTGAPDFDTREDIPGHCFLVGALELIWDPDQTWALYTMTALDRCRQVLSPAPNSGETPRLERQAPGWRLTFALYQRLLSLHAFQYKHTPLRAQFSSEAGFEQVRPPDQEQAAARDCPHNQLHTLTVLLGPDPASPPEAALALLKQDGRPEPGRETAGRAFSCRHFHPWEAAVEAEPVLHPDWWRLARVDYKSHLASACGCEH
ncbi:MAG: hypothetical protein KKB57_01575 [Proteobacteria bacterium]|nr:hypothetical protein [Pseudomonadota bacterium]